MEAKAQLDAAIEKARTWSVHGLVIEVHTSTESEEKEETDLAIHIGCDTDDDMVKKAYDSDFKSRRNKGICEKLYLSSEFNSKSEKGRAAVWKFISNLFDGCGGGIVATGGTKKDADDEVFHCSGIA